MDASRNSKLQRNRLTVELFVEAQVSSRKNPARRGIDDLLGTLATGDRLIVSELSRLGRSLGQVIRIVDELVKQKFRFVAIKEGIRFEGKQDMQTKVMIALFGLFAEVERDLISPRTKEGLAAARAKGRLLGRPKGALGTLIPLKDQLTAEVQAKIRMKQEEINARPENKAITDEMESVNQSLKRYLEPAGPGAIGHGQDTPHGYVWRFLRK